MGIVSPSATRFHRSKEEENKSKSRSPTPIDDLNDMHDIDVGAEDNL